jgi:uncharacterized protein DUF6584
MRTLERAENEVAQGRLWRAKEILQSSIPNFGYNVELFEMLGVVLLKMGDLPEAGKFLFLSGIRMSEYDPAIEIFLRKYGNIQPHDFFRLLPRKARLAALSEYPDCVAQKLRELDFPETLKDKDGKAAIGSEGGSDTFFVVACLTIALVVVALVILGVIKIKEIIF